MSESAKTTQTKKTSARKTPTRKSQTTTDSGSHDTFTLWDLRVETHAVPGREMVCNHPEGSYFEVRGEELHFPVGQPFPMYPLAALLPLLPAKQRPTDAADWMTTDTDIACPDPHCGAVFRITRIARRTFRHGDVTVVPMPAATGSGPED